MEWSNKVISLINLYRDRPVLWNCILNEYKDRNKRHEGFVEIAVSFGVAREEVERKIKNLICHFSRQIKKNLKITARHSEKFRKPPPHLYSRFNSSTSSKMKFFISSLTPYRALPSTKARMYTKSSIPWFMTLLINYYYGCSNNMQVLVGIHCD